MRKIFIFSFLAVLFFVELASAADLDLVGVGAGPMGMGKSGLAISDDIDTIFLNPAGLSEVGTRQFTSLYTKSLDEVNYIVAGGAIPLKVGTFGLSYTGAQVSGIPITTVLSDGSLNQDNISFANYSSYIAALSYGAYIGAKEYGLSSGLRLKLFGDNLSAGSATGFDADLGFRFQPVPWLRFAILQENLIPASMGASMNWNTGLKEGIPSRTRGAVGFIYEESHLAMEAGFEKYTLDKNAPFQLRGGLEWWPTTVLALRLGFDQDLLPSEGGGAVNIVTEPTAGIGLRFGGFLFDYAYRPYAGYNGNNGNFFSISYLGKNDFSSPDVQYKFVEEGIYRGSSLEVGLKVSEPVALLKAKMPNGEDIDLKPNAKGLALLRWKVPLDIPLGNNQIKFTAQDLQNNTAELKIGFMVLTREPMIEITSPNNRRVITKEDNINIEGKISGEKLFVNDEELEVGEKLDLNVRVPKIGLNRITIKVLGENGREEEREILVLRTGREK